MGKNLLVFLMASTSIVGLTIGVSISNAWAQGQGKTSIEQRLVDVEFEQVAIEEAVSKLFAKVDGKFKLDPQVKGTVTVSLKNVLFEQALANVLRQVNATWRAKEGIYEIVPKPQPQIDQARFAAEERERYGVDIRQAIFELMKNGGAGYSMSPHIKGRVRIDENELKSLPFEAALQRILKQANATYRVADGFYEFLPVETQDPGKKLVNISFEGEDVRSAIRKLFRSVEVPYSIGVDVEGTVSVNFKNVPLDSALTTMLSQVHATYQVEGDVYQIVSRSQVVPPKVEVVSESPGRSVGNWLDSVAITQDDKFLYILKGDVLYKVNKSDLKTVGMRKLGE